MLSGVSEFQLQGKGDTGAGGVDGDRDKYQGVSREKILYI